MLPTFLIKKIVREEKVIQIQLEIPELEPISQKEIIFDEEDGRGVLQLDIF